MDGYSENQHLEEMMAPYMNQTQSGFVCMPCGSVYALKSSFKTHFRDLHFNRSTQYVCPGCKRSYRSKNSFKVHISTKHKELKGLLIDKCAVKLA